jgi:hypothetical protein
MHQNDLANQNYRAFLNRTVEPLLPYLTATMRGLDYGSGPEPALSQIFAEHGYTLDLYDPYFAPLDLTSAGLYDFITCTETIEHFAHPLIEFTQIDNLLAHGGIFACMTDVYDESRAFETWSYLRDATHLSIYSAETFVWLSDYFRWQMEIPHKNVRIFTKSSLNRE